MVKWLHANGAAEDITRTVEEDGFTPMLSACKGGHLSVCEWLFEVGADGDISRSNNHGITPMHMACRGGHLLVCGWLFNVGADVDITRTTEPGHAPMLLACRGGHLPVCKWLFEVGAAEDISRADTIGWTPMYAACRYGHLPVCKWLFEMGADGDISRADNDGVTPMRQACLHSYLSICEWLVLKGALNDPDSAGQHITQAIVERDVAASFLGQETPPHLLAWAQGVVAASDSFRSTIIMGTFSPLLTDTAATAALLRRALVANGNTIDCAATIVDTLPEDLQPALLQKLRPRPAISKLSGLSGLLELVADFLGGVRRGRELRNARELAGCLVAMSVDPAVSLEEAFEQAEAQFLLGDASALGEFGW